MREDVDEGEDWRCARMILRLSGGRRSRSFFLVSEAACWSEGSLLGAVGSQILSKTSSQVKSGVGKVARLRLSVKDNGIGISAEGRFPCTPPGFMVWLTAHIARRSATPLSGRSQQQGRLLESSGTR